VKSPGTIGLNPADGDVGTADAPREPPQASLPTRPDEGRDAAFGERAAAADGCPRRSAADAACSAHSRTRARSPLHSYARALTRRQEWRPATRTFRARRDAGDEGREVARCEEGRSSQGRCVACSCYKRRGSQARRLLVWSERFLSRDVSIVALIRRLSALTPFLGRGR